MQGGKGALSASLYPPAATIKLIFDELHGDGRVLLSHPQEHDGLADGSVCNTAEVLPKRQRGDPAGQILFGEETRGYLVVVPRRGTAAAADWPVLATGQPRPYRIHRLVCLCPKSKVASHSCDVPGCWSQAHIVPATQQQNMCDAVRRKRMARQRRARDDTLRTPLRARAPCEPTFSLCSNNPALTQDARFPMTGFHSPSKLARLARRLGTRDAPPPLLNPTAFDCMGTSPSHL